MGAKKNDVERSSTRQTSSITEPPGAENSSPARGGKLRGFYTDESASLWNGDWIEQEALAFPFTGCQGPALVIATPAGFIPFFDLSTQGRRENQDHKSWRVTSSDKAYIWEEEGDRAQQDVPKPPLIRRRSSMSYALEYGA